MIKDTIQLYKRLLPYISPFWRRIVLAFVCALPLSFCTAVIAYLVKPALDKVFLAKDLKMLAVIPVAVVVLYSVKGALEFAFHYLLGSTAHRIMTDFRNLLYAHMQTLPLTFFIKNPTGHLIARITNDVSLLQRAMSSAVINIFRHLLTIIWLTGVLLTQDIKLAGIAFLILPWIAVPILKFGRKSRKFSTRSQQKVGRIATFVHETITGCRIVKAFGMEEYENKRFSKENERLLRVRLKRLKVRALSAPLMEFIGGIAGAAVIFYGGYNVFNGTSTPGTFFSFVAALLLMYGPIRNIGTAFQDIQEGLAAAVRVFYILDTVPEIQDSEDAAPLASFKQNIVFQSVSFAYDQEPVLSDINLTIHHGETVAIVGMTGSGKTTLVNLIPRFFDVTSGMVCFDGQDIRKATVLSLRSQIALVSQHPDLFNDTVRTNIAYGVTRQSDEEIIAAAKAACAHEFIMQLPEGYDTVIGEHGETLSGGQRQRLAIARAIFKNAPLLILDEPTASLDSQLENNIQQSLEQFIAKDRTTLIISHRLSTIRKADRIIVLSAGRVVEEGTHEDLFNRGGEYTKLYSVYLEDELSPAHGVSG